MSAINFTKIDGTSVMRLFRWIKVLRMGKNDIQECKQAVPFGVDSNPLKGMVAIYSRASCDGEAAIIGYIHKHNIADIGEIRLFATDDDDNEKFYVWLKKNGTLELGGDSENLTRFSPLNQALTQVTTDINAEFTVIAGLFAGLGVTYVPTPITVDILAAKINEIKTL
jgi:hypothetical protein